jgi:hypothetical protein
MDKKYLIRFGYSHNFTIKRRSAAEVKWDSDYIPENAYVYQK